MVFARDPSLRCRASRVRHPATDGSERSPAEVDGPSSTGVRVAVCWPSIDHRRVAVREVELVGKYWMTADVALVRDMRPASPLATLSYRFREDDQEDPGDVPIELSDGTLLLAQTYERLDDGQGWYYLKLLRQERGVNGEPFPDMNVVLSDLDLEDAAYHAPGDHPYTGIFVDAAPSLPLPQAGRARAQSVSWLFESTQHVGTPIPTVGPMADRPLRLVAEGGLSERLPRIATCGLWLRRPAPARHPLRPLSCPSQLVRC